MFPFPYASLNSVAIITNCNTDGTIFSSQMKIDRKSNYFNDLRTEHRNSRVDRWCERTQNRMSTGSCYLDNSCTAAFGGKFRFFSYLSSLLESNNCGRTPR
ncbi:hypothetical protein WA026_009132 [Henosepilachna vigintioctopunctata]|uniref:Uncharacterized protein n=1 Tax=Henosepilachna vigintioctopunctata TaxID=420089 RepID=A0AAW1UZ96_9CUCU